MSKWVYKILKITLFIVQASVFLILSYALLEEVTQFEDLLDLIDMPAEGLIIITGILSSTAWCCIYHFKTFYILRESKNKTLRKSHSKTLWFGPIAFAIFSLAFAIYGTSQSMNDSNEDLIFGISLVIIILVFAILTIVEYRNVLKRYKNLISNAQSNQIDQIGLNKHKRVTSE